MELLKETLFSLLFSFGFYLLSELTNGSEQTKLEVKELLTPAQTYTTFTWQLYLELLVYALMNYPLNLTLTAYFIDFEK
tara:strand:- start:78 stop:314 length:237 start_codon:yes stop_codon:yes gene_type:complete